MRLQRAHDADRAVRAIDGDVNVHAEDQFATRDVLQHVDERAVALTAGDVLALEQAERVRAGAAEPKPLRCGRCDRVGAKAAQLALNVRDRSADGGVELHEGLEQFRRHELSEVTLLLGHEDALDALYQIERLGVEQHVLLLDADRQRFAVAEVVIENIERTTLRRHQLERTSGLHASNNVAVSTLVHPFQLRSRACRISAVVTCCTSGRR